MPFWNKSLIVEDAENASAWHMFMEGKISHIYKTIYTIGMFADVDI
jgi:hypothetical protein